MPRRLVLSTLAMAFPFAAMAEVPAVVADTPVAHSFVSMVMGDLGTPDLLLDRGGDPHHAQLRPSQARAVAHADLIVWSGAALAPWMGRVVESLTTGTTLDLSAVDGIHTMPFQRTILFDETATHEDHDDDGETHEHDDHDDDAHDDHDSAEMHQHDGDSHDDHDADHDDDHAHEEDAHDHGPIDPHLWMTTENAAPWLTAIAAQLSTLDPENAARYSANAEAARAEIDTLEAELRTTLAPVGDAGLIMYHGAYGYFAHQFDLNVLGTVRLGDAAEPGAARIAALLEALSHANATCIFPEANHAPNHVDLVAAEIGLRMGDALDPAGVMRDPGPDHYAATMRAMAQTIADCVTRP